MSFFFNDVRQICTYVAHGTLYSQEIHIYKHLFDLVFQKVEYSHLEMSEGLVPCMKLGSGIYK